MIGGSGPGRLSRLLQNNTPNEILVFDLSLATGLYALTTTREQLWALDVVVSVEAFLTSAIERRMLDWTGTPALVLGRLGLLTDRVRNVQVCNGRWAQTPARIGFRRRADLSVVPRWGCDVLIFRGRA